MQPPNRVAAPASQLLPHLLTQQPLVAAYGNYSLDLTSLASFLAPFFARQGFIWGLRCSRPTQRVQPNTHSPTPPASHQHLQIAATSQVACIHTNKKLAALALLVSSSSSYLISSQQQLLLQSLASATSLWLAQHRPAALHMHIGAYVQGSNSSSCNRSIPPAAASARALRTPITRIQSHQVFPASASACQAGPAHFSAAAAQQHQQCLKPSAVTPSTSSRSSFPAIMMSAYRDDSSWAYSHKPASDACTTMASTALTKRPPAVTAPEQAADALTGMLLTSPTKKARMSGGEAAATSVAGYSPELSKALKSVVKIFTTMARCASQATACTVQRSCWFAHLPVAAAWTRKSACVLC